MNNTIAAISTGMSPGGIGIVRISGDKALYIVNKSCDRDIFKYKRNTCNYVNIIDNKNNIIDEALIIIMKKPHSYTGEDLIEIQCHGGIYIVKKVLNIVLSNGARMADPGEFTKRAFLNGKIDLSQAEAVMDLINSNSEYSRISSIKQLKGNVGEKINNIMKKILHNIAFIENDINNDDNHEDKKYGYRLKNNVLNIIKSIDVLINSFKVGNIIKNGINTAIVGNTNVGKSSLMNAILNKNRVIVTNVHGTTRDIIEEQINFDNITLNLIDTAGLRKSNDKIENIGIKLTKKCIKEADLILYVLDGNRILKSEDKKMIISLKNKNFIIIINKIDLKQNIDENELKNILKSNKLKTNIIVKISAKNKKNIDKLINKIISIFSLKNLKINEEIFITNQRHLILLKNTKKFLKKAILSINNKIPEDFISIDLTDAYNEISKITGNVIDEDLINEIFSKFCIGK